jgi:anaerobic magnesium-protoporphyrin IX monomethyl ester cyclase
VLAEIKDIRTRYGFDGVIGFHDDIFTLDTEWLARFGERYAREVALPFWCNAHIAELTEEIVKDLRRAGCFRVHVGIECGNEATRRNLLNKCISNQEILEKIRLLKQHHMKIVTTFMIGLPDEEEADILKSIDLCRAIGPDWVLLSTFCPYPGTRLYRDLVSEGRLSPGFYETLPAESFYSPTLTYHQEMIAREKLTYYFNHFRGLSGVRG